MIIEKIEKKLISYYQGNVNDIDHFMKVHSYAKMIAELENLSQETIYIIEIAAIVHDIACPLCREKYGIADPSKQEQESEALLRPFLEEFDIPTILLERIIYLVSHHHTYVNVDGIDYQILIEADFIVNATENISYRDRLPMSKEYLFKTNTGKELLKSIFSL